MNAWPHWIALGALSLALCWEHHARQKDVARLSSRLAALGAQQTIAPSGAALPALQQLLRAAPPAPQQEAQPAARPEARPEARPAPPPEPQDAVAEAQERFLLDPVDPVWAPRTERGLSDQLAPLLREDGRLERVECHGTLCRLETLHPSPTALERFQQQAFLEPGDAQHQPLWQGATQYEPPQLLPDGRVLAVAYLVREPTP